MHGVAVRRGIRVVIVAALISIAVGLAIQAVDRKLRQETLASSTGSIRTINAAAVTYRQLYGKYPPSLSALGSPHEGQSTSAAASGLIDDVLASGEKAGYQYEYHQIQSPGKDPSDGYEVRASPIDRKLNQQPYFFTDQTGIVRMEFGHAASATSPPIGRSNKF